MGLLNLFKGKDYRRHEEKGDAYTQAKDFGRAKLEYESGLQKVEKQAAEYDEVDRIKKRLQKKIQKCKESLALEHKQAGDDLVESGYDEDARQYYELAMSLTRDETLKTKLQICLEAIEQREKKEIEDNFEEFEDYEEEELEPDIIDQGEEYFEALCNALPDDIRGEYMSYGEAFALGYIALNRGEFETAVEQLEQALEENPEPKSYIPLELATAYLHLENYNRTGTLAKDFLEHHPDALPAYQVMCEVYWAQKLFDQAESLLESVPQELKESLHYYLLKGESLTRAGYHKEAESIFTDFMKKYGWNQQIALAKAVLHEHKGELEQARDVYGDILSQCTSCGQQVDPLIKNKYADLSLLTGQHSTQVLEIYFSLVQDNPENAGEYYQKISQIYELEGHEDVARRFQLIARKYE
jgi:tetratricopeptide (TPR) repeat protein